MKNIPIGEPIIAPDFVSIPLDLSGFNLPPRLPDNYVKKQEFHVTLVGKGHRLINRLERNKLMTYDWAKEFSMNACRGALKDVRFSVHILPKFLKVEKNYTEPTLHTRRSVIALCEVESAGLCGRNYHEILSGIYGASVEPPPFHITLYTYDDEMSCKGIGLIEPWELEMYAKEAKEREIVNSLSVLS
jgi:hypothetical protein